MNNKKLQEVYGHCLVASMKLIGQYNETAAKQVAGDAYTRIIRKMEKGDNPELIANIMNTESKASFRIIYTFVKYAGGDEIRKYKKEIGTSVSSIDEDYLNGYNCADSAPTPDEVTDFYMRRKLVHEVLEELPLEQRQLYFKLLGSERKTLTGKARELGIPKSDIMELICNIQARLRQRCAL